MDDPQSIDGRPQLERDIIIYELVKQLAFTPEEATNFVQLPVVEKVLLLNMLQRIEATQKTLGTEIGKALFQSRPECTSFRLQLLHERYATFQRDGYLHNQILRILSLCIEIVNLDNVDFYKTHNELCNILPLRDQRHQVVNHEPQIYLIPAMFLRSGADIFKNGLAAPFWNSISGSLSEAPIEAPKTDPLSAPTQHSAAGLRAYAQLTNLGVSRGIAQKLVGKLVKTHGNACVEIVERFVEQKWTAIDLKCLSQDSSRRGWYIAPIALLDIEKIMIDHGLPAKEVRDILIDRPSITIADPRKVQLAITTFLEVGFDASTIMRFIISKPRILTLPPEKIRAWSIGIVEQGLHAESSLRLLFRESKKWQRLPRLSPHLTPTIAPPVLKPAIAASPSRAEPIRQTNCEETDETGNRIVYRSESSTPAQHQRGWKKEIQKLLRVTDEKWFTEHWREFEEESAWMWDRSGPTPAILDHFALWLNIKEFHVADTPALQFIAKLLKNQELHPVLRLSASALQHRLAAIRRYTARDFVEETELLLLRWERVAPEELRYRLHTIEANGKDPTCAPYLIMLVEPSREEFLARLERTIAIERRA